MYKLIMHTNNIADSWNTEIAYFENCDYDLAQRVLGDLEIWTNDYMSFSLQKFEFEKGTIEQITDSILKKYSYKE